VANALLDNPRTRPRSDDARQARRSRPALARSPSAARISGPRSCGPASASRRGPRTRCATMLRFPGGGRHARLSRPRGCGRAARAGLTVHVPRGAGWAASTAARSRPATCSRVGPGRRRDRHARLAGPPIAGAGREPGAAGRRTARRRDLRRARCAPGVTWVIDDGSDDGRPAPSRRRRADPGRRPARPRPVTWARSRCRRRGADHPRGRPPGPWAATRSRPWSSPRTCRCSPNCGRVAGNLVQCRWRTRSRRCVSGRDVPPRDAAGHASTAAIAGRPGGSTPRGLTPAPRPGRTCATAMAAAS
jgi:hypothetical protein